MQTLQAALAEVASRTAAVLGDDLVGVWLVGSLARHDLAPDSDADVLAVTRAHAGDWRRALGSVVVTVAQRWPLRGLEYVVYDAAAVATPRWPLAPLLNVNAGPRMPTVVDADVTAEHWYLLDLSMALSAARALLGPPLDEVVGQPPRADVMAAIRASVAWHREHETTAANAVLNACRGWRFAVDGVWLDKTAAGRWAAPRLPASLAATVATARARRAAGDPSPLEPAAVRYLLDDVAARLRSLSGRPAEAD